MSSPLTWAPQEWYARVYRDRPLYPYQLDILVAMERAVWQAYTGGGTEEIVGCMARQAGKNHLDCAWTQRGLLTFGPRVKAGHFPRIETFQAIKSAPTRDPQITVSWMRLQDAIQRLSGTLYPREEWQPLRGYIYRLRSFPALIAFLSAQERASRRGLTANGWFTVDECQHTSLDVWENDLSPMRSTTSAPAFFFGTMWDEQSLMTRKIEELRVLEAKDGKRRVFTVPWDEVAKYNEDYGRFVEREAQRLTWSHPKMQSEYLLTVPTKIGSMFAPEDLVQLAGQHGRQEKAGSQVLYVGGVDFCGADEQPDEMAYDPSWTEKRDNTCVTVARLDWMTQKGEDGETERCPRIELVYIVFWPGQRPEALVDRIEQILFIRFHCIRAAVDGRGVGDGPAATLEARWGKDQVHVVQSTPRDVDRMGQRLQGAVKSGRLKLYQADSDQALELMRTQFRELRRRIMPNGLTRWGHPERKVIINGELTNVHDDGPKSLALCLEAGYEHMAAYYPAGQRPTRFAHWDEVAGLPEGRAEGRAA